jgi:lysophospholipase L1-like esterase
VDRRWIFGGLLIAGGVGVVRAVTAHPRLHRDTRLLFFGDSLAQGLSPHLRDLATETGVPYVGTGVVGSRIDQWTSSQWLGEQLVTLQPTLVLVALGTNDAYSRLSPEAVAASAELLLSRIPESAEVVWVGVPALPAKYGANSPSQEVLEAIVEVAPSYFPSHGLEIPRGPDGLHPSAAGYAGWAGAIWDWLS